MGSPDVVLLRLQGPGDHRALPADWRSQIPGRGLPATTRQFAMAAAPAATHASGHGQRPARDVRTHAARHGRLRPDDGDAAAQYLYATLNHGTPLYTWCEERGPEPGSAKSTGDRQHLWTPVAVVRAIRDCFLMEDSGGLNLALGADRQWLAGGGPVGMERGATHFGPVTFQMRYDKANSRVSGQIQFVEDRPCPWARLHIRLPGKLRVVAVNRESGAEILPNGEALQWKLPRGKLRFQATIGEAK